ncbi:MAG: hypothetical protein HY237_14675 [Acidobacteria bacterium]|nr:hypothetical protein [Acidobacteriota bacterium]
MTAIEGGSWAWGPAMTRYSLTSQHDGARGTHQLPTSLHGFWFEVNPKFKKWLSSPLVLLSFHRKIWNPFTVAKQDAQAKRNRVAIRFARRMKKVNPELSDSILIAVGKRFGIGAQMAVEKALKLEWTPEPEEDENEA